MSNFNEISSVDSKFDTINKFYEDLKKTETVKSQTGQKKQRKKNVRKHTSLLYEELIGIYKKEYDQTFESKGKELRQKYDYKNLKDLDYQADEEDKEDEEDEED